MIQGHILFLKGSNYQHIMNFNTTLRHLDGKITDSFNLSPIKSMLTTFLDGACLLFPLGGSGWRHQGRVQDCVTDEGTLRGSDKTGKSLARRAYLVVRESIVRPASPAEEEEDEDECEKDVEHDDEREERVGYEGQTSVLVSWRSREVGILPQPCQGEVVEEGVREYDVHLCVEL